MSSDGWAQYAEYARRLDAVRTEEFARTSGMREGVAAMSAHADELEARLNGQGGMLTTLATTLGFRRPNLAPIPPEGFVEPATTLGEVGQAIDVGDAESRHAAERGYYPALLPKMSGLMRSLTVYGVAALLVVLLQGLEFKESGTHASGLTVLFVIPLIGFVIGFAVLALGSKVRIDAVRETARLGNPTRAQAAQAAALKAAAAPRTRMGAVLCFGIGPVALLIVLASSVKTK